MKEHVGIVKDMLLYHLYTLIQRLWEGRRGTGGRVQGWCSPVFPVVDG